MISFILFTVLFVACSLGGLFLHNRANKNHQPENNDALGLIFGAASLIYSLIISFAIVAVWTDYEEVNSTVELETDKLNRIITHGSILPESFQNAVRTDIRGYCRMVVNTEWGESDKLNMNAAAIPKMRLRLATFHTQNKVEEKVLLHIDDVLNDVSDLHRKRLGHTHSHVPSFIWLVLVLNSSMIIYMSFFFQFVRATLKLVFVSLLSAMIAMSLFLIYMLDHPFTFGSEISNEPYKNIIYLSNCPLKAP